MGKECARGVDQTLPGQWLTSQKILYVCLYVHKNGIWRVDLCFDALQTSSVELKTNWVLAKYKWYAFVEELRISSKEYLVEVCNNSCGHTFVHAFLVVWILGTEV
jgi:hypothetical protein